MTEAEWLACDDPAIMLSFVSGQVSDRKLRLFACACCRQVKHLLSDGHCRKALGLAERYADGGATDASLAAAARFAEWGTEASTSGGRKGRYARWALRWATQRELYAQAIVADCVSAGQPREALARILRDVVGYPGRRAAVSPAWAPPAVLPLATAAYECRDEDGALDPYRLMVLADALEETGSAGPDILGHLRSPGPHVRGCWALDLALDLQ